MKSTNHQRAQTIILLLHGSRILVHPSTTGAQVGGDAVLSAAIAVGNVFTAQVNHFIQRPNGKVTLQDAAYFFFFKVMLVTAVLWLIASRFCRGKTYIQDEPKPTA